MTHHDWSRIAQDIKTYYEDYDSFIILHGTDTMAFTCSVLSFMLNNLSKTVIVTGSQIPLSMQVCPACFALMMCSLFVKRCVCCWMCAEE